MRNDKELKTAIDGDMRHVGSDSALRTIFMKLIDVKRSVIFAFIPVMLVLAVLGIYYIYGLVLNLTAVSTNSSIDDVLESSGGVFDDFIVNVGNLSDWFWVAFVLQVLIGRFLFRRWMKLSGDQAAAMTDDIYLDGVMLYETASVFNEAAVQANARLDFSEGAMTGFPVEYSGTRPEGTPVSITDDKGEEYKINDLEYTDYENISEKEENQRNLKEVQNGTVSD